MVNILQTENSLDEFLFSALDMLLDLQIMSYQDQIVDTFIGLCMKDTANSIAYKFKVYKECLDNVIDLMTKLKKDGEIRYLLVDSLPTLYFPEQDAYYSGVDFKRLEK